MGYYSKAVSTEHIASRSLSDVLVQVTYPLYAKTQDDKMAMQNMIKRLTMTVSYITFPMMFILMLLAKPIFVLLYTEKWVESVPYFQILCFAGLFECLQSINFLSIPAIGRSKTSFMWTMIKRVVGILLMVGGLALFGIKGLLVGMVCNAVFSYAVNIGLVSRYIGYKWYRQLKDSFPMFVVSILAAIICYVCGLLLNLNMYIEGSVKLFVFAIFYMGWSIIFKPEAFSFFKATTMSMISKIRVKK